LSQISLAFNVLIILHEVKHFFAQFVQLVALRPNGATVQRHNGRKKIG